jgi:glycosyltransferase involved in cell wall biosynthesis
MPLVSVVIATYNRSNVLRHAIQSVRDSTFTDWEMIVVGDACTDDTDTCVSGFNDPRIRFVNLPERTGYQSGPNNRGIALAQGQYIALLNHDDLYLPEHLGVCIAALESIGADFVWTPFAVAGPRDGAMPGERPFRFTIEGLPSPSGGYTPRSFYVASCWVFRRELVDRVGPWLAPDRFVVTPSQAWLFRAWRLGAGLVCVPEFSVIMVPAGPRRDSYRDRESTDHESLLRWMRETKSFRDEIAREAEAARRAAAPRMLRKVRRWLMGPLDAASVALGIHPATLRLRLVHGFGRGGQVRDHRIKTGSAQ